jgi:hypothetical protein
MTKEYLRMQKLSGVITESEYNQKVENLENPQQTTETQETLNENVVGIGAINNPFLKKEKTDYEIAFEHFVNEEKEPVKEYEEMSGLDPDQEYGTKERDPMTGNIKEEDQEEVDADSKELDKTEDALDQSEEDNESLEDRIKHHEDAIDSIRKELSDLKKDLGEDEEDKKEEEEEK